MPFMYLAIAAILCAGFQLHWGFFAGALICFCVDWFIAIVTGDDSDDPAVEGRA